MGTGGRWGGGEGERGAETPPGSAGRVSGADADGVMGVCVPDMMHGRGSGNVGIRESGNCFRGSIEGAFGVLDARGVCKPCQGVFRGEMYRCMD